jgi:hypothetical protein
MVQKRYKIGKYFLVLLYILLIKLKKKQKIRSAVSVEM